MLVSSWPYVTASRRRVCQHVRSKYPTNGDLRDPGAARTSTYQHDAHFTSDDLVLSSRSISFSRMALSCLTCNSRSILPIFFRKIMLWWAILNLSMRLLLVPVKAPFLWPKSSDLMSWAGKIAQLSLTICLCRRAMLGVGPLPAIPCSCQSRPISALVLAYKGVPGGRNGSSRELISILSS